MLCGMAEKKKQNLGPQETNCNAHYTLMPSPLQSATSLHLHYCSEYENSKGCHHCPVPWTTSSNPHQ